jgi:hypothetical protein
MCGIDNSWQVLLERLDLNIQVVERVAFACSLQASVLTVSTVL